MSVCQKTPTAPTKLWPASKRGKTVDSTGRLIPSRPVTRMAWWPGVWLTMTPARGEVRSEIGRPLGVGHRPSPVPRLGLHLTHLVEAGAEHRLGRLVEVDEAALVIEHQHRRGDVGRELPSEDEDHALLHARHRRRTLLRPEVTDVDEGADALGGLDELLDHVQHDLGGRLDLVHLPDGLADEVVHEVLGAGVAWRPRGRSGPGPRR